MRRLPGIRALSFVVVLAGDLGLYYAVGFHTLLYNATSAAATVALIVAAVRRRGVERAARLALALGTLLFFLGDSLWAGWFGNDGAAFPSLADAAYLAAYPALAIGVVLIFPWRRARLGYLVDVAVLAAAGGGIIWFVLIDPVVEASDGTFGKMVSAAYPTMDLLLLSVLVYAAFAAASWPLSLQLLVTAFGFMLASDLVYSWMLAHGTYASGSWVDSGWIVYYVTLAYAALLPADAAALAPGRSRHAARWGRFALVAAAAVLLPIALLMHALGFRRIGDTGSAVFAAAIIVLVLVRLGFLVHEQHAAEDERAALLRRSLEAADQERSRVARDLHDGPIQALTAIVLKLDLLSRRMERAGGEEVPLLAEIRTDAAAEIASLRRVMADLRPPVLDERGLAVALEDCAQAVLGGSDVECAVQTAVNGTRPAAEIETLLYRLTREALINVRKHARARHAGVHVEERHDHLHLTIQDDGIGFEPAGAGRSSTHLGLVSMRERVASVGGEWRLRSAPGAGTTIEAIVPCRPS